MIVGLGVIADVLWNRPMCPASGESFRTPNCVSSAYPGFDLRSRGLDESSWFFIRVVVALGDRVSGHGAGEVADLSPLHFHVVILGSSSKVRGRTCLVF